MKCNGFNNSLLLIAGYPIIWWFILFRHCGHGFARYMFGVTLYALLSYFYSGLHRKEECTEIGDN